MNVAVKTLDARRQVVDVGHRRKIAIVGPLIVAHLVKMPETKWRKVLAGIELGTPTQNLIHSLDDGHSAEKPFKVVDEGLKKPHEIVELRPRLIKLIGKLFGMGKFIQLRRK